MKRRIWIAGTWVALAAAAILAACGGGSSGNSSSGMAGASGVITGFGSVFVNGKEFATDTHTQVLDGDNDDAASATANLQVGMTVDVDASSGTATMLRFTSAVRMSQRLTAGAMLFDLVYLTQDDLWGTLPGREQ